MRKLGIYLALLVSLFLVVELLWRTPLQRGGEAPPVTRVVAVVDVVTGDPVDDASVLRLDAAGAPVGSARPVDRGGRVSITVSSPRLLRVEAVGYHSRTVAIGPEDSLTVPMAPDADGSVTVRVGGGVTMDAGVLAGAPAATEGPVGVETSPEERLLSAVAPLLQDADLTLVDLESPLVDDPDTGSASGSLHPDKSSARVSHTALAPALAAAGVDVVNLANSHAYDALGPGLASTLQALDEQHIAHMGAGATADQAWAPAYVEKGGRTVAFLGCTTRAGRGFAVPVTAAADRGGAARCRPGRLRREVVTAAARSDAVVVVLHGGPVSEPTTATGESADQEVDRLAETAAGAGAALVVGARGRSVRPVADVDGVPWVRSPGALVAGDPAWTSLGSALVTASVVHGATATLTVDALARIDQRPVPVVGSLADGVVRAIAGPSSGLLALGDQTAYWPRSRGHQNAERTGPPGEVAAAGTAWWPLAGQPGARTGRDLLWGTGSMEDLDTDPATNGSTLWDLGKYVTTSMEAGCHGVQGMRLRRGPLSERDVVISPSARQPVLPGTQLTLTANVLMASQGASLEVRWYRTLDPTRRSAGAASVAIDPKRLGAPCAPVRLDLVVPEGMVAAQPYVRLSPRHDVNLAAELRVDDVRLVAWDDGRQPDRLADTVEHLVDGEVLLRRDGTDVSRADVSP